MHLVGVVIALGGYVLAAAVVLAWPTQSNAGADSVQAAPPAVQQGAGHIQILATSVALPLALTPFPSGHAGRSAELAVRLRPIEPLYLAGWYDRERGMMGLAHKNQVVEIERSRVARLQIVFVRRAKGPGFDSLEAVLAAGQGTVSLLSSARYREEALEWLTRTAPAPEALFDLKSVVVDAGEDY